jgi:hypothetical protein
MKTTLLLSVSVWLVSLFIIVAAVLAADFGVASWVFVLLFAWLLTVGFPTALAVVIVSSFWNWDGLGPFFGLAASIGLLFQTWAVYGFRRLWRFWCDARIPKSPV